MTKVIILGEPAEKKEGKKIEFTHILLVDQSIDSTNASPRSYECIELVVKGYHSDPQEGFDIMYAYNEDRNEGNMYLGHFNDGIV